MTTSDAMPGTQKTTEGPKQALNMVVKSSQTVLSVVSCK